MTCGDGSPAQHAMFDSVGIPCVDLSKGNLSRESTRQTCPSFNRHSKVVSASILYCLHRNKAMCWHTTAHIITPREEGIASHGLNNKETILSK